MAARPSQPSPQLPPVTTKSVQEPQPVLPQTPQRLIVPHRNQHTPLVQSATTHVAPAKTPDSKRLAVPVLASRRGTGARLTGTAALRATDDIAPLPVTGKRPVRTQLSDCDRQDMLITRVPLVVSGGRANDDCQARGTTP